MKKVRIGLLLLFLILTGAWLSAAESIVLENEQPVLTSKTAQADTVRMTLVVEGTSSSKFNFKGEEGATYEVDWGDGETETYTGKGEKTNVVCSHLYDNSGTYNVLLYGVSK